MTALIVPATVTAAPPPLKGIDVSHYNGQPDWAKVQADGIDFVFAKATEGSTYQDPEYLSNKQQAEALGLTFGAYYFARPGKAAGDATADANNFIAFAQLNDDNLLPVLDLEDSGGMSARKLTKWVKEWVGEVHAQLGVKAIIYTSASFWKSNMARTTWFAHNGYPLWLASWTTAASPKVPASNWGGQGWTLWQWTNVGSVRGIKGAVDLDRYNGGSVDALRIKNNR